MAPPCSVATFPWNVSFVEVNVPFGTVTPSAKFEIELVSFRIAPPFLLELEL